MDERAIKGIGIPSLNGYFDVAIENGIIKEVKPGRKSSSNILIPGFLDTHIHGFGGFGTEDCSEEAILSMSSRLIRYGVTSFFPTLYTDTVEKMDKALEAVSAAKGKETGASIEGIHIEGPFISPKRIGAQNPEGRKDPNLALFRHFISKAPGLIKAMTIAPELEGAGEIAAEAGKMGIVLLAGHTDASYEETIEGARMGIRHATHLFNAMKGLHHRNPGTVGAVLSDDSMTTEIIADGLHVHPAVFKIALEAKGDEKIVAITDSLHPTGQESGEFTANGIPVVLKNGLWVTKGNEDLIQGSALNMHQAFRNMVSWGIGIRSAVNMTSANAARIYSLNDIGSVAVGKKANLLILNDKLDLIEVIKCGTTV